MKIVYCLPSTYRMGGIERIVSGKANMFAEMGYDVIIITTDQQGKQPYFKISDKIKCYDLGINFDKNQRRRFIKKIFYYFYNAYLHKNRLKKLLMGLKADIVISTFFSEMGILPQIKDGSKKIVEFHFSRPMFRFTRRKGIKGYIDDFMMHQIIHSLRKYDRFVVLSHEDADNWKELNNVVVINNVCAIDITERATLEEHRVISVGRYEYPKGFDRLINAWALIAKRVPGWSLHIFGEGSLRLVLTKQIKDLHLENSVFLEGASSDVGKELSKSSIAVFSSIYEGFLMAIVEAESAGLPVVSFDAPCGPKDIIRDGEDGFLVKNGDIESLGERLLTLMQDDGLRKEMGAKAFENSKRFTPEVIMPQWLSLFETILKK
jgi:glycosyltransferase involved in cell wall biosynthesis